jgi:hypothetical protein
LLWLTEHPLFRAVPWWSAFLVLTIVGERLDLSRLVPIPRAAGLAIRVTVLVYVAGIMMTLVAMDLGIRLAGFATVALALWLLRYDVARRTVRQQGVSRFIAVCILSGAIWLAASGVLALTFGDVRAGLHYDALLHTLYLGFVFALIFGHAPIILPAVTGLSLAFRSAFYAHLALLHGSVLMRLVADLEGSVTLRRWSGLVSAVALGLFLFNTAWGVWSGRRQQRPSGEVATATPVFLGDGTAHAASSARHGFLLRLRRWGRPEWIGQPGQAVDHERLNREQHNGDHQHGELPQVGQQSQ